MPEFTKKICTGLRWLDNKLIAHNASKDAHPNGFNLGSDHVFHLYANKVVSSNPSSDNIGDVYIHDSNGTRLVVFGADTLLSDNGKSYIISYIGTFDDINNKFVGNIKIGTEWNPSDRNNPDQYFNTSGEMRWCTCMDPTSPGHLANKRYVDKIMPSGMVSWFYSSTAPSGWVVCNGRWYSSDGRSSSNSQTATCTIQTPNLIGKYPLGATSNIGGIVNAGLPNLPHHTHTALWQNAGPNGTTVGTLPLGTMSIPSFVITSVRNADQTSTTRDTTTYSDSIYGNSSTVTPPSVKLLPCMKL
jgi:hypothetical protein